MKTYTRPLLAATTMNTTITSGNEQLWNMFGYCIQVTITGIPTGTLKLQASCDPIVKGSVNQPSPTHWSDISGSSVPVSAAGSVMWNISDVFYNYVRLIYTDGSGGASTASIIANFNAKGV